MIAELPNVKAVLEQTTFVEIDPDSSEVTDLVNRYREQYGFGPRERALERGKLWTGARYKGRLIAVVADRRDGLAVEVTSAYDDGSPEGKAAVVALAMSYRELLRRREILSLTFQVLQANTDFRKALHREGLKPLVLTYYLTPENLP